MRVLGDAIVLKCDSYCAPDMPVNWWYKNKAIEREDSKYIFTQDHGLVILNATKADEGSYMCVSSGKYWLTAYEVELPGRELSSMWLLSHIVCEYRLLLYYSK